MKKELFQIFLFVILFILFCDANSQQVMWQRIYGQAGFVETGRDIIHTFDGGYLIIGNKDSPVSAYLIKTNYLGDLQWQKVINDTSGFLNVLSGQQLIDSGFVLTGKSEKDLCIIKADKNGNLVWKKNFNILGGEAIGRVIKITNDGGFIATGIISFISPPTEKTYVVKTDFAGNLDWERIYGDSISNGYDILQSPDKYYYITGISSSNFTNPYHGYLYKIDSFGNLIWVKNLPQNQLTTRILRLNSNNVVLAGIGYPNGIYFFKSDSSGMILVNKIILVDNPEFYFSSMCLNSSQKIIAAGKERYPQITGTNDFSAAILDTCGNLLYQKRLNTPQDAEDNCYNVKFTSDQGYIFVGDTEFGRSVGTKDNILVVKTDSLFNTTSLINIFNNLNILKIDYFLNQNYPNPFNSSTIIRYQLNKTAHVSLKIYTITGHTIGTLVNQKQEIGIYSLTLNGNKLASGCYFIRLLINGHFIDSKKILLLK